MKVSEIKVYNNDKEIKAEENIYQQRLEFFAAALNGIDVNSLFDKIPMLQGIPIAP